MFHAIFNKSRKQQPIRLLLYDHLPPSHKLSIYDEQEIVGAVEELKGKSLMIFSYELLHMGSLVLANQQRFI